MLDGVDRFAMRRGIRKGVFGDSRAWFYIGTGLWTLRIVRRRKWVVLQALIAGPVLAFIFTATQPKEYTATATLLFRQVFTAIPDELVEAARIDGAGPMRFLRDIVLPVSGANIAALFVILFVYGWNQYLWPLLVATDPGLDTIVIGIVKMIGVETQTEWSAVMATAVLALLPPVAVVVVMQRWFVAGLTEGEK